MGGDATHNRLQGVQRRSVKPNTFDPCPVHAVGGLIDDLLAAMNQRQRFSKRGSPHHAAKTGSKQLRKTSNRSSQT